MDVEVAIGEPSLRCHLISLVAMHEVDEEILGEVLADSDVLRSDRKPVAYGLLNDCRLHLWAILPELGHHAMHGEAVELVVHVINGEGHSTGVQRADRGVLGPGHRGPS